jgi:hypothetical protein
VKFAPQRVNDRFPYEDSPEHTQYGFERSGRIRKANRLIPALLTILIPLAFAYDFAQEKMMPQAATYQTHNDWYECLGEGAVTVFMWTFF